MSDEGDFLVDEEVTGEGQPEAGERAGLLSGALFNILKWVAIGLAAIILIATVSFVTFNLLIRGREPQGLPEFSMERPDADIDLEFFSNNLGSIRGQTADDPPLSFLASVSIGYKAGDTKVQTELIAKNERIQNAILRAEDRQPGTAAGGDQGDAERPADPRGSGARGAVQRSPDVLNRRGWAHD
jgi:flagellar basal body-associated protein FliL